MQKSESIKNLAESLVKFQAVMTPVKKEAENPFFKSKYADLASMIEAIRKPLSDNGLSFSQFPSGENGLTTILMHSSGEYILEEFKVTPVDAKPQSLGSAITYARRYSLGAILGIATEEDDDGAAASGTTIATEARRYPTPGHESTAPAKKPLTGAITPAQRNKLFALLKQKGRTQEQIEVFALKKYNVKGISAFTKQIASDLIEAMSKFPDAAAKSPAPQSEGGLPEIDIEHE